MNIIITMAGNGARFAEVGYPAPKPFIEVNDKHILEWTTRSLPFIQHYTGDQKHNLVFAIRTRHDEQFHVSDRLRAIYGADITIVKLDKPTRGNLETAYIAAQAVNNDDAMLFLDSDNYYDGSGFEVFLNRFLDDYGRFGAVAYFQPHDRSYKWCFAFPDGYKVTRLSEKDKYAIDNGGMPMVGVFYFNNKNLFNEVAAKILESDKTVADEFYMSQAMAALIDNDVNVFGHEVTDVIPLGTPKDVIVARDLLNNVSTPV